MPTNPTTLAARAALPEQNVVESRRIASALGHLGFRVESVSPRGVGFAGPATLFERIFHSEIISTDGGHAFAGSPDLPAPLSSAGVRLYFPTRPDYHPEERSTR